MRAIFISDAHLKFARDDRYGQLINFLNDIKEGKICFLRKSKDEDRKLFPIDDLYIVGDLFDFWFCEKEGIYPEFQPIISKLTELHKSGIKIHLCEGNHDFFMQEYFQDVLGMEVFEEWANIQLDEVRALVGHGDTADKTNIKYILFRKFLRSSFFYRMQSFIPSSIRWALASFSSTASKEMTIERGDVLVGKMRSFADNKFQENYDAVIVGHCHKPFMHDYTIAGKKKTFVSLGDWINRYSFLCYDNGVFSLEYYSPS
jgi:UDP-2,3-diacylglucosamine hydrolase